LQEGDSISVAFHFFEQWNDMYVGATVSSANALRGRVNVPFADSIVLNVRAISIFFHSCSDSVLVISSIRLKNYSKIYAREIMHNIWDPRGLAFEFDTQSNAIKSPIDKNAPLIYFSININHFFRYSHPAGFQLFLRLSLLSTLLILIFILTIQSPAQRFILFAITLYLASLPLNHNYTIYAMAFMSLTMIIAFIYNKSRRFTWQPMYYVLAGMYLLYVIGVLYSADRDKGIQRLDTSVVLILFPVVFSMIQITKKNVNLLLRFFVWSAIAFCAFGFLSYVTIVPEFTWNMAFRDGKFFAPLLIMWPAHHHPSNVSTILLMAVPIALYLRYSPSPTLPKREGVEIGKQILFIEMLLGVSLPVVFTILSGARVGMVMTPALLGLGYLFYCKFRPALKWGLVVAGIAALCVMFYLHSDTIDRFTDPVRVDLRKTAISAIKEKPVFGWGTGYVEPFIHSEERAHSLGIETPYTFNHFHNQYLENMVQFGIPGILILLVLFGWMLWKGIREKNYLLLSLLVIYVLFCWTETAMHSSKGVVPFAFWICFLMGKREE